MDNAENNALRAMSVPEVETQRDFTVGRDQEVLMRGIYDEVIAKLMEKGMPVTLKLSSSSITGTPPFQYNNLAEVAGTEPWILLHVFEHKHTEDGHHYYATVMTPGMKILSDGDVKLRDWHLIHYLQKAAEIRYND